jgi:hypothetical protein
MSSPVLEPQFGAGGYVLVHLNSNPRIEYRPLCLLDRHGALPALCVLSDIEALSQREAENGDKFANVKMESIVNKLEMAFPVYHALQVDGAVSSDVLLGWWLVQTYVHSFLGFMEQYFTGYVLSWVFRQC